MKMKYPHYEGTLEVVEIQIHLLILAHRPGDNRDHAVSSLSSVNEMIVSIISDEIVKIVKPVEGSLYMYNMQCYNLCQLLDS